ncbi:MAG: hypothetical protein AAGF07_04090 [Patescibacteria group bacterium]
MKVQVSLKGRGKKLSRKGRLAQGYYARRQGILRFYAFDDAPLGNKINSRQPIPLKKKKKLKY